MLPGGIFTHQDFNVDGNPMRVFCEVPARKGMRQWLAP
jgi:hypothetical protein